MFLNLYMLEDLLTELHFQGQMNDDLSWRTLAYPVLCDEWPNPVTEEALYVIRADQLPASPAVSPHASILCFGKPPEAYLGNLCNFYYTEDPSVSAHSLINQLNHAFFSYNRWESLLMTNSADQNGYQRAIRSLAELVGNPAEVWQASIYLLCHYFPPSPTYLARYAKFKEDNPFSRGYIMSEDALRDLITDQEYTDSYYQHKPTIYSGKPHGYRTLYCNIWSNDTPYARVCISEILRPLTDRDFVLIQIFAEHLGRILSQEAVHAFPQQNKYLSVVTGLLKHQLQTETKIQRFLAENRWNPHDEYVCFVVTSKISSPQHSLDYAAFSLQLGKVFSHMNYVMYNSQLVLIFNGTAAGKTRDEIYHQLLPALRDSYFTASVSTSFFDFKQLYYYYQQALVAGALGRELSPGKWFYRFEDYQVEYLIRQYQSRLSKEALIPPALRQLIAYDRARQTSFTETLKVYLETGCNAALTTQKLYLHRNTLPYRLTRIQEITKMDLHAPDHRLILELAFRLLDPKDTEDANSAKER